MIRSLLAALALWVAMAPGATAQTATLVADRVRIEQDERLVAEGNVEVLHDGVRLRATRVTYDRGTDRLDIVGPIRLENDEDVLVLADQAALDADLENGILESARLVLDRQLQLAAAQIARVGGRYLELSNTVASACEICAGNPTPTWEIRARRVIHDREARQLYFSGASFRFLGVPIAYFPRLRLPDPTNTRTTGFLIPRLRSTSQLGAGVKQPFFATLGEHADITLTPYLSPQTRTLEGVYRQAFRYGDIQFRGAYTRDDILPGEERYFLFGEGAFQMPRGLTLEFDIEEASDPAYLINYGYSEQDRLASELRIYRAERDMLLTGTLSRLQTLRESEIPIEDRLPYIYGTASFEKRLSLRGGELRFGLDAATLSRESDAPVIGRDVSSLTLSADYLYDVVLPMGVLASTQAGLRASGYETVGDTRFDPETGRLIPNVSAELRWPLQRMGPGGTSHLIEPILGLAWSTVKGNPVPNEDSVLVEFDEGNLFSMSRYPGLDAVETGARANIGVSYTAVTPSGLSAGFLLGRVLRADADEAFAPGSGLDGTRSDWLAATRLSFGERVQMTARAIFDDDLETVKNETRLNYMDARLSLETGYVWLNAEPAENRIRDTHELTVDGSYRVSRHWIATLDGRYDFNQDRAARAGFGLEYRTECISIDMSVSRRFTGGGTVEPSTDVGFSVSLAGFGSDGYDSTYRRACNG